MQTVIENFEQTKEQEKVGANDMTNNKAMEISTTENRDFLISQGKQNILVPKENVEFLYQLIKKNCQMHESYGYRFMVRKLIEAKEWDIDIDAFNGGRWRSKVYMPFYYNVLKVLEWEKVIFHNKRGNITWIKVRGE